MASPTNDESLYPIAVLIDELRDDDVALKLNSIRRLSTIALALGDKRTRDELLPYLVESKPEEDELMVALADEVGNLVPYVGGPAHAHCLVPLLEGLARQDETVVREQAVKSLCKVGEELNKEQANAHLVPCIRKLKSAEWFTSRVSVCGLFAVTYPHCDSKLQSELRGFFSSLCRDDTPMVRRAAAVAIGDFAATMEPYDVQQSLLPLFSALLTDDQESVRKLALESVPKLIKALSETEVMPDVLAACMNIIQDRSWRVRHAATARMPDIAAAFGPQLAHENLVKPYVAMLQDQEPEVRAIAAETVVKFCENIPLSRSAVLPEIVLPLKALSTDSSQHVRVALATSVLQLANKCSAEDSGQILELILTLLKDKVPDVRLNVISNLHHAHELLGAEQLKSSVVPAIEELAVDSHWRVRHAVIEKIPLLAEQLGQEFYEDRLLQRNREWLRDPVATIRDAAVKAFINAAEVLGQPWADEKATPVLLAHLEDTFYLFRITTMQAMPVLAKVISHDALIQTVLPALLKTADDPVPNVRFNLCKVLEALAPDLESSDGVVAKTVVPVLKMLEEDSDHDVSFFASQAQQTFAAS